MKPTNYKLNGLKQISQFGLNQLKNGIVVPYKINNNQIKAGANSYS